MAVKYHLVGVFFLVGFGAGLVVSCIAFSFSKGTMFIHSSSLVPKEFTDLDVTVAPPVDEAGQDDGVHIAYRSPMSHEEVNRAPMPDKVKEFKDELYHKGTFFFLFPKIMENCMNFEILLVT